MFTGIGKVKASLDSVYGAGKVSLANAAVRWMVHHSQLDPKFGGELDVNVCIKIMLAEQHCLVGILPKVACAPITATLKKHPLHKEKHIHRIVLVLPKPHPVWRFKH